MWQRKFLEFWTSRNKHMYKLDDILCHVSVLDQSSHDGIPPPIANFAFSMWQAQCVATCEYLKTMKHFSRVLSESNTTMERAGNEIIILSTKGQSIVVTALRISQLSAADKSSCIKWNIGLLIVQALWTIQNSRNIVLKKKFFNCSVFVNNEDRKSILQLN